MRSAGPIVADQPVDSGMKVRPLAFATWQFRDRRIDVAFDRALHDHVSVCVAEV